MDELIPQKIIVSDETFDWMLAWLDSPESDEAPKLAKLFRKERAFEHGLDSSQDAAGSGTT